MMNYKFYLFLNLNDFKGFVNNEKIFTSEKEGRIVQTGTL